MKLITTAIFALGLSIIPAAAAEKKQSKTAVKMPKAAKVAEVKAPFDNHWSANSWESSSQDNFWTAKVPTPAKAANKKN